MQKCVTCKLNGFEFVNQVLDQILTDWEEAKSLEKDFQKQESIALDSKNFKFWDIRFTLEAFQEGETEDEDYSSYFSEEEIREWIKCALIEIENYFKD